MALALAAVTVAATRRPKDALPILAAGVLVDLDHLVDLAYYRVRGPGRFIAPLHGWEYVIGLLGLDRRAWTVDHGPGRSLHGPRSTPYGPHTWRLLAAGLAAHLALDQIHAPRNPLAYWVLYRLAHRFRWEVMDFIPPPNEDWKDTPWWRWV